MQVLENIQPDMMAMMRRNPNHRQQPYYWLANKWVLSQKTVFMWAMQSVIFRREGLLACKQWWRYLAILISQISLHNGVQML